MSPEDAGGFTQEDEAGFGGVTWGLPSKFIDWDRSLEAWSSTVMDKHPTLPITDLWTRVLMLARLVASFSN